MSVTLAVTFVLMIGITGTVGSVGNNGCLDGGRALEPPVFSPTPTP